MYTYICLGGVALEPIWQGVKNSSEDNYTKSSMGSVTAYSGTLRRYALMLITLGSWVDCFLIVLCLYVVSEAFLISWDDRLTNYALLSIIVFYAAGQVGGLYRSARVRRLRSAYFKITANLLFVLLSVLVLQALTQVDYPQNPIFFLSWMVFAWCLVVLAHTSVRLSTRYLRASGYDMRTVALVGVTEKSLAMRKAFEQHPWMGFSVLGYFDDRAFSRCNHLQSTEIIGDTEKLVKMCEKALVDNVYICLPLAAERRIRCLVKRLSNSTVSIYFCPDLNDVSWLSGGATQIMDHWVMNLVETPFVGHYRVMKRLEDLVIALLLFPLLTPLMLLIALMVRITSPGPAFYVQTRSGVDGKPFRMYKFRSMFSENSHMAFRQASKDDARVTPLGAFLRKTSLDELPQLINVLKGDMSIVGPRPHPDVVNDSLRNKIQSYMLRHKIKPGITGLAQVSGLRGETPTLEKMEQRIEKDLEYIRHWSLWLDLKILFKTLWRFTGKDVY